MRSIIQDEKICYITGRGDSLEEHHVYGGYNRRLSEQYGLKVYLIRELHRGPNGAHCNHELDLKIKEEVQKIAMEYYNWDIEDFRRKFGKSYI